MTQTVPLWSSQSSVGIDTSTTCFITEWGVKPEESTGAAGTEGVPHTTREVRAFWEWYPKWHPHSHAQFQRLY